MFDNESGAMEVEGPDMPAQGYEIDQNGTVLTCRFLAREVTHTDMQDAIEACMDRARNDNAQNFVFDLAEVDYVASACIGVLVTFLQDIEPMRGRMAMANCRENVLFLFKVTQLDGVFHDFDDVEEAVESF